jgi:hypothetical protein
VDRYRRVQRFIEAFFPKIAEFQKPPRHVKWREVNLAATLPGWNRFEAAQAWLDNQRGNEAKAEDQLILRQTAASGGAARSGGAAPAASASVNVPSQDAALYQEFLRWRQQQRQPAR